jgi:hypothetical protein
MLYYILFSTLTFFVGEAIVDKWPFWIEYTVYFSYCFHTWFALLKTRFIES